MVESRWVGFSTEELQVIEMGLRTTTPTGWGGIVGALRSEIISLLNPPPPTPEERADALLEAWQKDGRPVYGAFVAGDIAAEIQAALEADRQARQ